MAMIASSRIVRFSLTTVDALALAAFYENAFECVRISSYRQQGSVFEELMGVRGGADRITLALGDQIIELLQFDQPGAPYPEAATASDLCFQHFAIVVPDMARAWQRLCALKAWSAITTGGPQKLPVASGGVTAFKFRDPEGHPLEFLMFPQGRSPAKWQNHKENGLCLGIDHSAISISNADAALRFYGSLGLTKTICTQNKGLSQDALDGLTKVDVEVMTLEASVSTPHLELLAYRNGPKHLPKPVQAHDIACTRLIFESAQAQSQTLTDPDGHRMIVVPGNQDHKYSSQLRPAI
jgi:catechol 2,3-dioxygenase-like lactoylglutathione lyase family enzyme